METTNEAAITSFNFGSGHFGVISDGVQPAGTEFTLGCQLAAWDFITGNLVSLGETDIQSKFLASSGNFASFGFNLGGITLNPGIKYYIGYIVTSMFTSTAADVFLATWNAAGVNEFGNDPADDPDLGWLGVGGFGSNLATPGMQVTFVINGTEVIGSSFSPAGTGPQGQSPTIHHAKTTTIRDHTITLNSLVYNEDAGTCIVQVKGNNLPVGISSFSGTWTWGDGSPPESGNSGNTRNHTYTSFEEFIITFTGVDSNGVTYISEVIADCRNPFVICDYNIDPARSSGDVTSELVEDTQGTNRVLNHFITGVNAVKVGFNDASIPGTAAETSTAGEGIGGSLYRWWKTPQNAVKVEFSQDVNPDHIFNAGNPSRSGPLKAKVITNTI